jgi:transposase
LAAITYKDGVTQTQLDEWNETGRRTIYSWLMRCDTDEPLVKAVTDDQRSGRNRKLSNDELEQFRRTVRESSERAGYDEPAWKTKLVRHHLKETYGVEYSMSSCRRLLKEAGLSYQKPLSANAKAEPKKPRRIRRNPQKTAGRWTPQ